MPGRFIVYEGGEEKRNNNAGYAGIISLLFYQEA
jgi:NAD/NADP transhydrogenase beta subunit